MKILTHFVLIMMCLAPSLALAASVPEDHLATLRQKPLTEEPTPPPIAPVKNGDVTDTRSYPMQPPVIPHKIDGYQVDTKVNKCMSCHSRTKSHYSNAPMVSVTHYMDRDDNFLIGISPRRYFCEQCHVVQKDAQPLIESEFVDMEQLRQLETNTQSQN